MSIRRLALAVAASLVLVGNGSAWADGYAQRSGAGMHYMGRTGGYGSHSVHSVYRGYNRPSYNHRFYSQRFHHHQHRGFVSRYSTGAVDVGFSVAPELQYAPDYSYQQPMQYFAPPAAVHYVPAQPQVVYAPAPITQTYVIVRRAPRCGCE